MRPSILIAVSLLAACTSADILRVDPAPRPALAQAVPVLLDEPSSSYRSIALIEVSGGFGHRSSG